MTGRAPATGPGSSPSSERSGPAQPAARRGARRALLPGQECAARRAHTHPGAPPKRTLRLGCRGHGRTRTLRRLLPGVFESQQLVTVGSPFSTALFPYAWPREGRIGAQSWGGVGSCLLAGETEARSWRWVGARDYLKPLAGLAFCLPARLPSGQPLSHRNLE